LTFDRRRDDQDHVIRLGVIGLGRAFTLMLPTFSLDPRVRLVAAYDPGPEASARFVVDFDGVAHTSAQSLCSDPRIQAVYIASPHQFHAEHVELAARHGKHILVEKPMALTVSDALAMIACAHNHQVQLLVGHSHSYDAPYLRTRELISSDRYGAARMVTALNYTDFLYRPRRPEELETRLGGGVVFSQAAHQVDVVRLLVGSPAVTVRASTGNWDEKRPTEGAYSVHIQFANGAFASLTYSGYGRFDTDEFNGWVGELGQSRNPESYGTARAMLGQAHSQADEIKLKEQRAYGTATQGGYKKTAENLRHNHFGLIIVSCERADLRPVPNGVIIHDDTARWLDRLDEPTVPRAEVIDELYAAVIDGKAPLHSGEWGLATLEICTAILASAAANRTIVLEHQI
jgi:phthalate 4,5-cis-dihydrodiol dehydrogenase